MSQAYFDKLNATLKARSRAIPQAIIDLDLLDQNIDRLQQQLRPEAPLRLVAKSLPAEGLLEYIAERMQVRKLMVFHQPFLSQLAASAKWDDLLLGKPLPVDAARYFYQQHLKHAQHPEHPEHPEQKPQQTLDPFKQIQWLVDTTERLEQYEQLALELGQPLRINLEIDVGLRRGGFASKSSLRAALQQIADSKATLHLSGLMGYDPHVTKIPSFVKSTRSLLKAANEFYSSCIGLIRQDFPELWSEKLTFNGAGSPTISLHKQDSPLNDISAGSCLLKPTTFDIAELAGFAPACFIATPVLKVFEGTTLPALEKLKGIFNWLRPAYRQSAFIYGGFWKADYCYPEGLRRNAIFGDSTNQTMVNAPEGTPLKVDDFIFLRPHQSEFVLLQFGALLAHRNGEIEAEWAPLSN